MSVWLEIPRRSSDSRQEASERTTVRSAFQNSHEILFRFEPCPDGVAQSSGRSHISCTQFPYQDFARPDHRICRSDG
jgi:hypothetical protein